MGKGERAHAMRGSAARDAALASTPQFSARWALFLDIDGTLLDHAEHPAAVHVDAHVLDLLNRLRDAHDGAVALISGRAVADIDALFHPLRLPVAGQHGVERRDAQERLHRHALPVEGLRHAAERIALMAAHHPGLVFEDKGLNLALHYRRAPHMEREVQRLMRELLGELGDQFELQSGKLVWEIKPSGRDKGTAVAEFLQEPPFAGRQPVFIGDDLTDEFGFALVNSVGGHSIKVGTGPSQANWRLPDARSVRRWLDELARYGLVASRT